MSESTWAPSPYADTLQTVQKLVAGYVLMPVDEETLETAAAGVRRAIDRLNTRNWNWAATYSTITFVSGTQEYALDHGFKSAKNFALRDTNDKDVGRLAYLPWGTFLKEAQWNSSSVATGSPRRYSVANVNLFGVVQMDVTPGASFVATYPTGRLWYYRRVQYPGGISTSLDVPSEVVGFIQATAEGFAADRYAVAKARDAYARAEMFLRELIADDGNVQTDLE